MSSIDERVVDMKFDNAKFEQNIKTTTASLENLKKGLNFDAATKGINELDSAGKKFSLAGMANGVESIAGKLSTLGILGITALTNIANKAVDAGITLVKSLTIDPIKTGLQEYETQINAVQTILANTQSKGKTLQDVNAALNELNKYADQTIYNFTEMTRNIGTFTAAGVGLESSVSSIKGIANLAAVSGSTSQQASTAMYQLSQAIASGTVKLMDWNSVVNAGMGGKTFQEALYRTGKAMGSIITIGSGKNKVAYTIDEWVKSGNSFRDSLQSGWLTSEVLTKTLSTFTGDLNKEQLKAMGYSKEQIKDIMKLGKTAQDAATKVKTMTQLFDTLKEAAQSGWAQSWQIVFGDFEEAKKLFTDISNVLGPMISNMSEARNEMLQGWKDLGGRTKLIDSLSNIFSSMMDIVNAIGEAFSEIFPPATAKDLFDIANNFLSFTRSLKMGSEDLENLKRTFKGVFAIFSIGWEILKQVGSTIMSLFGSVSEGTGGFLQFTANLGDWLVKLDEAIKKGKGLTLFFEGLKAVLQVPINLLKALGGLIAGGDISGFLDQMKSSLDPMAAVGDRISEAFGGTIDALRKVWGFFSPLATLIGNGVSWVSDKIKEAMLGLDFTDIATGAGIGVLATIGLSFNKLIKTLTGGISNLDGVTTTIKEIFGGLKSQLEAMQNSLKAKTLMMIAGAIALLSASVVALSMVKAEDLVKAITALGVLFKMLEVALTTFEKLSQGKGMSSLGTLAASLILLSIAVNILASAAVKLSTVDWEGLAKGLIGVGGLLGSLALFTKFAGVDKGGMAKGAGLILLAVAIKILASAIGDFASMSWEDIAKGGVALAGSLLAIAGAMKLMPKSILIMGPGLVALSVAITILAAAFKIFSTMSWEELAKGAAAMTGALIGIALAMKLMPKSIFFMGPALLLVATAITVLAGALQIMGSMGWEEIGKGLTVLAGSMLILVGAMAIAQNAVGGAIAIGIIAGALAILAPVLLAFGNMSWEQIAAGLAMLAGTFLVLGLAGLALTPVVPTLIALGVAIALLGAGVALAGVGLMAFSAGLILLSAAGAAGTAALVAMVAALIGLIPMILIKIGEGIIGILGVIADSGSAFIDAAVTLLSSLITAIGIVGPQAIDVLFDLIMQLVDKLEVNVPKFVDSGLKMINGILRGIRDNISETVTVALEVVAEFINGIAKGLPKVLESAANLIISFVNGVADTIEKKSTELGAAGGRMAVAIINGMIKGISAGIGEIVSAITRMANEALDAAKRALGIASPSKEFENIGKYVTEGFAKGIHGSIPWAEVVKSEIDETLDTLKETLKLFIEDSEKEVKAAQDKVKKLTKKKKKSKKDKEALKKAKEELEQAKKENAAAKKAAEELEKQRKAEQAQLNKLSEAYEKNAAALDEATRAYDDAVNARDSYASSVKDQYSAIPGFTDGQSYTDMLNEVAAKYQEVEDKVKSAEEALQSAKQAMADSAKAIKDQFSKLPSFGEDTTYESYVDSIQKRIEATEKFRNDMSTLRSIGLDDETYKSLLDQGLDAQPFVTQLIEAGPEGMEKLKELYASLAEQAGYLGSTVSQEFYQSGVDAAQAIVDGLGSEEEAARNALLDAADNYVGGFSQDLKNQIASNKKIAADLESLRKLGLSDRAYKELISKGDSAQPFITDLISKGKEGVDEVNNLIKDLDSSATDLGDTVAKNLYQAGVDAARGIVDGLISEQDAIVAQMNKIADAMVEAIKKQLGIKSPSREFATVGGYAMLGLATGLQKMVPTLEHKAEDVGDSTLDALKQALSDISKVVTNDIDMNPTIRPVLDLSDLERDAMRISGILTPRTIDVGSSYSSAAGIATATRLRDQETSAYSDESVDGEHATIVFKQYNNSPKALSNGEIYRQTNNQLAKIKGGLPK